MHIQAVATKTVRKVQFYSGLFIISLLFSLLPVAHNGDFLATAYAQESESSSLQSDSGNPQVQAQPQSGVALEQVLDENGRLALPAGFSGSIDPTGYRMVQGQEGEPQFVQAAAAGDENWDDRFTLHPEVGYIKQILAAPDGTIYVVGRKGSHFEDVYMWQNHVWTDITAKAFFVNSPKFNAIALDHLGNLYVGGDFICFADVITFECRVDNVGRYAYNLAKWDGTKWWAVGGSMLYEDARIYALAVDDANNLYVGGAFNTVCAGEIYVGPGYLECTSSIWAGNIAKWDGTSWSTLGAGVNGKVTRIVSSGSDIYFSGEFNALCSEVNCATSTAAGYVAKWDGTGLGNLGGGANNYIYALAVHGNDLYVGGQFSNLCAESGCIESSYLGKWDGSAWSAVGGGINNVVYTLYHDGTYLYVGGPFTAVSEENGYTYSVRNVVAWGGSYWQPMAYGVKPKYTWDFEDSISFATGVDGIYIAGAFAAICKSADCSLGSHRDGLTMAKWTGDTIQPIGQGVGNSRAVTHGSANSYDTISAMAVDATGKLYVAGRFNAVGDTDASSIAMWDGTTWSRIAQNVSALQGDYHTFDGTIYALAIDSLGNLYAGGTFTTLTRCTSYCFPSSAYLLAKWNGSSWSSLPHPIGKSIPSSDYYVSALAVDGFNNLYVAGKFSSTCLPGETACVPRNNIARWANGSWWSLGFGFDGPVNALAFHSNGTLYAGGAFTNRCLDVFCSTKARVNRIARWTGSAWAAMRMGLNGDVLTLLAGPDNMLYAGGRFTLTCTTSACASSPISSLYVSVPKIAKWNGVNWLGLGSGFGATDEVRSLGFDNAGILYANGTLAAPYNGIARWDQSTWSPLGSGLSGSVYSNPRSALKVVANSLYVGGDFDYAGGKHSNRFARYAIPEAQAAAVFDSGEVFTKESDIVEEEQETTDETTLFLPLVQR